MLSGSNIRLFNPYILIPNDLKPISTSRVKNWGFLKVGLKDSLSKETGKGAGLIKTPHLKAKKGELRAI